MKIKDEIKNEIDKYEKDIKDGKLSAPVPSVTRKDTDNA